MRILKRGKLSTFQDLGRFGYLSQGVNVCGAMDTYSLKTLNALLGNNLDEPALEMYFPAAQILFEEEAFFAIHGADFNPILNSKPLTLGKVYSAAEGDILRFTKKMSGERSYFSVVGGFGLDKWLGSASMNLALRYPEQSDSIILSVSDFERKKQLRPLPFHNELEVRFVPAFEYFDLQEGHSFTDTVYQISQDSNRMGYRLKGERIELERSSEMISAPVCRGIIQLLPDGQPVVLMSDAQVSGGYPKLGYVTPVDLDSLAQMAAGEKITFKPISAEESRDLFFKQKEEISCLEQTLKLWI